MFKNIYKNFRPGKDYNGRCFKIINQHYLKYIGPSPMLSIQVIFDILRDKKNVN